MVYVTESTLRITHSPLKDGGGDEHATATPAKTRTLAHFFMFHPRKATPRCRS